MRYTLTINDIVSRTGVRTARFTIPGKELVDGVQVREDTIRAASRNRYMVLSLPKHIGAFVKLRPELLSGRFQAGQAARALVGNVLNLPTEQIAERTFVFIEEVPLQSLDLVVDVDTDHAAVVKTVEDLTGAAAARGAGPGRVPQAKIEMRVDVVVVDDNGEVAMSQATIDILLLPMRKMPEYAGYLALDFGNTSTTLVVSDTSRRDQFDLVPADVLRKTTEPAAPVQTALGIWKIEPPALAGGFHQYEAAIGAQAFGARDPSWLVLGAKRLLSDRKPGASADETLVLGNTVYSIPAEDPAEVYISRILQGLFFHRQERPQSIAVTCPTTFTASEVSRLKRTVARAFHRVADGNAARFREEDVDSFVKLVIDEASAAAFYFAYRDFIMGPGETPAFRYLYPNGLNILIYDCGGGTTDLALVRLTAPTSGEMEISILGRAGHRHFGGDFITLQVFRLLKAKLAGVKRAFKELPKTPAQIARFLDENDGAIDRAVPTKYDRGQQQNDDAKRRRETTLALWRLAESLKVRLSAKGVREVKPDGICDRISEGDLLAQVFDRIGRPDGLEDADVQGMISISRAEVDALIDPEVDRTINYANDLIRHGMEAAAADAAGRGDGAPLEIPEVDRVYVVGNASRYPRIRERLEDPQHGLTIRYLKDRLAEVQPEEFKNSVAKGAIVARRMQDMNAATRVVWDDEFMNKLPFDLVSDTRARSGERVLFRRGQAYSKHLAAVRDIAPDARTGQATTQKVRIDRQWPGERDAEPCMIFQFREPIAGRFLIRYDEELAAFVMHPDRPNGADEMLVVAEPFEQAAYLAPPQSGRI